MNKKSYDIYVMHYTKQPERRRLLERILDKEHCSHNVIWIEEWDQEVIRYIDYVQNFKADHLEWQNRLQATGYKSFYPHYPLKPSEISLSLKTKLAMQMFLNSDKDVTLFLENDAILCEGFFEKLDESLSTLPDKFDCAFIGRGCKPLLNSIPGQFWHPRLEDRNTDSMVFSKKFVQSFIEFNDMYKMCYPIDHELNFYFQLARPSVFWREPTLVVQGSHLGIFDSFQDAHSRFLDETMITRSDLKELLK